VCEHKFLDLGQEIGAKSCFSPLFVASYRYSPYLCSAKMNKRVETPYYKLKEKKK